MSGCGATGQLVLVADDVADTLRIMKMFLELKGFRVAEAGGGEEAVAVAAETLPRLILLDLSMPDMDGLTAAKVMRQDLRLSATPIIIVSALDVPDVRSQVVGEGYMFIPKPIDFGHLCGLIEVVMGGL